MFRLIAISAFTAAAILMTSCASNKVTYLDPASNDRKIVRVGNIDQQDWGMAASTMIDSLLQSGVLDKSDGKKSVVLIGTIRNKTQEHVDLDLLTKKIRVAIMRSGKALVTTAIGVGGPEDASSMKLRKELRDNEEFDQSTIAEKGTLKSADLSLTGKIIQSNAKAGRTRQSVFTFQLSMTNVRNGLAVWEDEYEIIKQGKGKASVGF